MINALNSGARVFMADFEDANSPTWENCVEGQANLIDAVERTISLETGEQELPAERRDRDAARPPARLAPAREARARRRRAGLGAACSTSASTSSTTRRGARRARHGPVLLPAEAREPPRGAALERRLRRARRSALGLAARHDPRDRPDRDDPGRVRDGRDPLRAARALRRAERRPLGLHLQRDQEVPRPRRSSCCPTAPR